MVYWEAKRLCGFQAAGIHIENLGLVCHNKKVRMTSVIMEEWLRWFDCKLAGRKVALLIDNFLAHELAVENITQSPYPLQNTLLSGFRPMQQANISHLTKGSFVCGNTTGNGNGFSIRCGNMMLDETL